MSDASVVGVVIATRDRRLALHRTLDRLAALPEQPPVVVVDNGSHDGTPEAIRGAHPHVRVATLDRDVGAAARAIGVRALDTPLIAFTDDDSWWAPGALSRAAGLFDAHPRLGLIAAQILVGPEQRLDSTCVAMRESPLPREPDLPGPSVLGFVACGAIVRRAAFLSTGGFSSRMGFGGEEQLLALDLATAGWGLAYVEEVVAHHHPAPGPGRASRTRTELRNALVTAWMRRRRLGAARTSAKLAACALRRGEVGALLHAARGLKGVGRERRPVPRPVERGIRTLERTRR